MRWDLATAGRALPPEGFRAYIFSDFFRQYHDHFAEKLAKTVQSLFAAILRSDLWQMNANRVLDRSGKMLQNISFLAIVAVDTTENEPLKISMKWGFSMKWGSQTGVSPVAR